MKIILASHGSLADAMLNVLRMIIGDEDNVESLCLDVFENPVSLAKEAKKMIEAVDTEEVILLCDIIGGSVFNNLLPLCEKDNVTLLSGMNLDLVLNLVNTKPKTRTEIDTVIEEAKSGIAHFDKKILANMASENETDNF